MVSDRDERIGCVAATLVISNLRVQYADTERETLEDRRRALFCVCS